MSSAVWFRLFLVLGVVLRLLGPLAIDYRVDAGDARGYLQTAHNLLDHGVLSDEAEHPVPSVYRPPLYPAFVAMGLALLDSVWVVRLLQAALSLATVFLMMRIARQTSERLALVVGAILLLSPFEAAYAGAVLSETLTAFLMVAVAATLLTPSWPRTAAAGALAGLVVLCRDIYSPLLLVTGLTFVLRAQLPAAQRLARVAVFLVSALVVVLPWTVRNYRVEGRVIPVSAGRLGYSLWLGSWAVNDEFTLADSTGGERAYPPEAFRNEAEQAVVTQALLPSTPRQDGDRQLKDLALQRLREQPVQTVAIWLKRAPKLWLGTRFEIFELNQRLLPRGSLPWKAAKGVLWLTNAALMLAGLVGLALAVRRRSPMLLFALPILFTGAVYLPLNSFESRYSQPVLAFVALFAASAIAQAMELRSRGSSPG